MLRSSLRTGPSSPTNSLASRSSNLLACPLTNLQVNMMQFTQIGPGRCLGNHFDRRDKWREGIASVAWGEAESPTDARGDSWTLCMQQSAEQLGKVAKEVKLQLPPGSAYILTGQAQGRTAWCEKQSVAHQARAHPPTLLRTTYSPTYPPTLPPPSIRSHSTLALASTLTLTRPAPAAGRMASGTATRPASGTRSRCVRTMWTGDGTRRAGEATTATRRGAAEGSAARCRGHE